MTRKIKQKKLNETFMLLFVPRFGFDYGLVHYVVMSTEHDFYQGSEQYYWIANHLASVDRSATPWLVFTGHRQDLRN